MQKKDHNYDLILLQFSKLNFSENSRLSLHQLQDNLNTLSQKNTNEKYFDYQVLEEIFQNTEKTHDHTVLLKNFISTVLRAQKILKQHIDQCHRKLNTEGNNERQLQEIQINLAQLQGDYKTVTEPFQIGKQKKKKQLTKEFEEDPSFLKFLQQNFSKKSVSILRSHKIRSFEDLKKFTESKIEEIDLKKTELACLRSFQLSKKKS